MVFNFIPGYARDARFFNMYPSSQTSAPSMSGMPSLSSTSILLGEEKVRRAAAKKKGRASTNITGGLVGNPTLGRPALWGV